MYYFYLICLFIYLLFFSSLGSRKRALYLILSSSPLWIKKNSLKTPLRRVTGCEEGKQTTRVIEMCSSVVSFLKANRQQEWEKRTVLSHVYLDLLGVNTENWERSEFRNDWILWVLKKKCCFLVWTGNWTSDLGLCVFTGYS